jgi:LysR family hca operon transcriptional activator
MNLRHLSVFHGVAKTGSVNAAARLLHTSQPAVSRELRTLENRLGRHLNRSAVAFLQAFE